VLAYSRQHPGIAEAAHFLLANHPKAAATIHDKGVAAFASYKIIEHSGQQVLEEFMRPLGTGANLDEGDPILALRNRLRGFQEGDEELNDHRRLGLIIKAFKLYTQGKPVKNLALKDSERYPRFEDAEPLHPSGDNELDDAAE
jgi:hypothetical protein